MSEYRVFLKDDLIDTVFYSGYESAVDVKQSLIDHDGYNVSIVVIEVGEHINTIIEAGEELVCNDEFLYLLAINCGMLDPDTLEFFDYLDVL